MHAFILKVFKLINSSFFKLLIIYPIPLPLQLHIQCKCIDLLLQIICFGMRERF